MRKEHSTILILSKNFNLLFFPCPEERPLRLLLLLFLPILLCPCQISTAVKILETMYKREISCWLRERGILVKVRSRKWSLAPKEQKEAKRTSPFDPEMIFHFQNGLFSKLARVQFNIVPTKLHIVYFEYPLVYCVCVSYPYLKESILWRIMTVVTSKGYVIWNERKSEASE